MYLSPSTNNSKPFLSTPCPPLWIRWHRLIQGRAIAIENFGGHATQLIQYFAEADTGCVLRSQCRSWSSTSCSRDPFLPPPPSYPQAYRTDLVAAWPSPQGTTVGYWTRGRLGRIPTAALPAPQPAHVHLLGPFHHGVLAQGGAKKRRPTAVCPIRPFLPPIATPERARHSVLAEIHCQLGNRAFAGVQLP